MKEIVIVGAGGFAREVAWLIEEINKVELSWKIIGFLDENYNEGKTLNGYPILSGEMLINKDIYLVLAIGSPETRKKVFERYSSFNYATLIHPKVSISSTNKIGKGSIICEGNILTVNIEIGEHVILNIDSTVGHDVKLHDFVTVLPSVNISGNVTIHQCTSIGTGTQIIQDKIIGKNSIVGAGSVVLKDVEDFVVAAGIPAKEIKTRNEE